MAFPIRRLIDVARRPIVETGANVPGYSGGFAACRVISCLDPEGGGARLTERFSERLLPALRFHSSSTSISFSNLMP
jgi:hypothetical protein